MKRKLTRLIALVMLLLFALTLSSCFKIARNKDRSPNIGINLKEKVTVELKLRGGILDDNEEDGWQLEYGEKLHELPTPAKKGYEFVGWFDDDTDEEFVPMQKIEKDTIFYAKWELITETDTSVDALPSFSLPVDGKIYKDYSDSVLIFSQTMNDYRIHLGIDVSANLGDEVLVVADGVITNVWTDAFMGICVSIQHSGNAVSVYKNLDPKLNGRTIMGASVKSGDVIGAIGQSAMNEIADEPHLHYELQINWKHVDPKDYIMFPSLKDEENESKIFSSKDISSE